MEFAERATRALLGLAVGDALGAPLEFSSPAEARSGAVGPRDDGRHGLGAGRVDGRHGDGAALAESIAEHGLIDLDDVARRYVAWASSGPKDIGIITRTALRT